MSLVFTSCSNNLRGRYNCCLYLSNKEAEAQTGTLLALVDPLEIGRFQPKDSGWRVQGLSNDQDSSSLVLWLKGQASESDRPGSQCRICDSFLPNRIIVF